MSEFNQVIDRHGTYSTQWDYIADRFGRSDILPFSISDMDIGIPNEITNVIKNRAQHPIWGYSRWQNDEYLKEITSWYDKRFETAINSNWISYSPSVMYSISKCLEIITSPQAGVLIFTPAYNGFFDVIINSDRQVIVSQLILNNDHYIIDWQDFKSKLEQVQVLLFCNPHNPIGKFWDDTILSKIIDLCYSKQIPIISDDIHMDIVFKKKFIPLLRYSQILNSLVVVTSISKTFNVPGLTGSYVIIPNEKWRMEFQRITRYRDFVNSPAILNVLSTIEAYRSCQYWIDELNQHIHGNKQLVKQFLLDKLPDLKCIESEACYFVWIDFSKLDIDDNEFQKLLVNYGKVGIMSGVNYGSNGRGFLRLNVGCSQLKLVEGLNRLKKTIDKVKT